MALSSDGKLFGWGWNKVGNDHFCLRKLDLASSWFTILTDHKHI